MFLALDVGNTAVKAGLHDGAGWARVTRWPSEATPTEAWAARLRAFVGGAGVERAGLASVVPALTEGLAEAVGAAWGVEPAEVRGTMPIPASAAPFRVAYRTPETLGADRVSAAAAAYLRFGRPAGRPVLALDAGTAVTLDAVAADGRHLGGAILPGPDVLRRALARDTAQLPEIPLEVPPAPIGRTTVEAMQSGLVTLLLGGLGSLIERTTAALADESPGAGSPFVVATGGAGPWLAAHLPARIHAIEPHLVLEGVRLLAGSA